MKKKFKYLPLIAISSVAIVSLLTPNLFKNETSLNVNSDTNNQLENNNGVLNNETQKVAVEQQASKSSYTRAIKDADVYRLRTLNYYGYCYVPYAESYPYAKYAVQLSWDQISKDLDAYYKGVSRNVEVRLSDKIIRKTSYGWMFFIDLVPKNGYEFVDSMKEYKTRTISVVWKNLHFLGDDRKPSYQNNVVEAWYTWDDYYRDNRKANNKLSNINNITDLVYNRHIIKSSNESNYIAVVKNIPQITADLNNYLVDAQGAKFFSIGASTSTFEDRGTSARMLFFVKPIPGYHWNDGTIISKEFYVNFDYIVTSPPTWFPSKKAFTPLKYSYKPNGITNPQKNKNWSNVDNFYSKQKIYVKNRLTSFPIYEALWDQIDNWWHKLSDAMYSGRWTYNLDISPSFNQITKKGDAWWATFYVIPKYGYAWTDGTRDAKPIRVGFGNVQLTSGYIPPVKQEKFYQQYGVSYFGADDGYGENSQNFKALANVPKNIDYNNLVDVSQVTKEQLTEYLNRNKQKVLDYFDVNHWRDFKNVVTSLDVNSVKKAANGSWTFDLVSTPKDGYTWSDEPGTKQSRITTVKFTNITSSWWKYNIFTKPPSSRATWWGVFIVNSYSQKDMEIGVKDQLISNSQLLSNLYPYLGVRGPDVKYVHVFMDPYSIVKEGQNFKVDVQIWLSNGYKWTDGTNTPFKLRIYFPNLWVGRPQDVIIGSPEGKIFSFNK